MWQLYHVFYLDKKGPSDPPQPKLTLCLRKDTLFHWCGRGLAISAGLATKSLATGAGGHCGQGLFALSTGRWWTDYDSKIPIYYNHNHIRCYRFLDTTKTVNHLILLNRTGAQCRRSLHLRGFASRTYETFWSRVFWGIPSDSTRTEVYPEVGRKQRKSRNN